MLHQGQEMKRGLVNSWAYLSRTANSQWPNAIRLTAPAVSTHKSRSRWFQTTTPRPTDGVFRGLTDDRLPTPWIEAFRKQQAGKGTTAASEAQPGKERDLSPRRMSDSYHRVVLPLGQDPWLSDTYLNSSGHIRLGTMFMDLDALSVSLNAPLGRSLLDPRIWYVDFGHVDIWLTTAAKGYHRLQAHGTGRYKDSFNSSFLPCDSRTIGPEGIRLDSGAMSPSIGPTFSQVLPTFSSLGKSLANSTPLYTVTVVTAALDRIKLSRPLTEITDLEYSGQVTYATGRSSVEITCKVARARPDGTPSQPEDVFLTCTFTMVALDPETKKPVPVPPLICETPEEEKTYKAGEAKSLVKKETAKTSLLATEPNDPESALIHQIWLQQVKWHDPNDEARQPANVVPMAKSQVSSATIMQPQVGPARPLASPSLYVG